MPRLSPSLSSSVTSVYSSSLSSPREDDLFFEPNTKFPPGDKPVFPGMAAIPESYFNAEASPIGGSASPPASPRGSASPPLGSFYLQRFVRNPSTASVRVRRVDPEQNKSRFHPYTTPIKATPLELRITLRSLGLSTQSVRTLEDTKQVCPPARIVFWGVSTELCRPRPRMLQF
jgi:hypothetical protein